MTSNRLAEAPTLADLSAATGIPGRTIRFYIAQGLLDGPDTTGRTARYSPRHLDRLQAIQSAKQQGLTLGEIRRRLAGTDEHRPDPTPDPVCVFSPTPEVTVLLRTDIPARRLHRLREALRIFAESVALDAPEETPTTRRSTTGSEAPVPKEES